MTDDIVTRTNAWITVEKDRALSWRDWLRWEIATASGEEAGEEPILSLWEEKAARRLGDMEYIFKAFLQPSILAKTWIMLSVYDVTQGEIESGYTHLGDAEEGGDFACAGYWEWRRHDDLSSFVDLGYPWRPTQLLKFMPDYDGTPATEVSDVNVLFGQPPRVFPD